MFGLSDRHIEELRGVLQSVPAVKEAIIYGSRARGDNQPYSDIDLTLRGDELTDNDLTHIYFLIDDLLLPYTIDLSLFSRLRNEALIANILNEGKVLYKDPRI